MCGIVGYVGHPPVVKPVLDALSRLEYRGYDSAGIAVCNGAGIEVRKRVGKLRQLMEALEREPLEEGRLIIVTLGPKRERGSLRESLASAAGQAAPSLHLENPTLMGASCARSTRASLPFSSSR